MKLLKFIEKESPESYQQLVLMVLISGIANGLLITIINHSVSSVVNNEDLTQYFLLYATTFILFLYTQWYAFDKAIVLIEKVIFKIRNRLNNKIRHVELSYIESTSVNKLYANITQNDTFISQAIPQMTAAAQMSVLLIFSFLYLAYLSPFAFIISLSTILLGFFIFHSQTIVIKTHIQQAKQKENIYFRAVSDILHGFKEIKVNQRKADEIVESINHTSSQARDIKINAGRKEARMWGFGRVFIYALLPILVFILPSFHEEHAANIFKVTSIMLFIAGPITILVNMMPIINRVNVVIQDMNQLEQAMDNAALLPKNNPNTHTTIPIKSDNFNYIRLNDLQFNYPTQVSSFSAGPFNETVQQGELLFIVGGNGSGKSTFLKLLTGLYFPNHGSIEVDGWKLQQSDYPIYRELFSIVFTDFHLFEKIYGVPNLNPDTVHHWLKKMKMHHKVRFQEGAFSSTSLSTGQRKRLAFIAAMLEDKPVLIIDEFAADQDPQFRQYFYEVLLPEIKATGKTVIAVTHDDHYFHIADRVLKMDEGKLSNY